MTEDLLHTIWKYKLLGLSEFAGVKNEQIKVVSIGEHNQNSGPDFFNSKIEINGVLLAGNVEIHIKTSDWLKHKHQNDNAYNNLVLHVVYEHDIELAQNEQFNVSVIELKNYIQPALLKQYNDIQFSKLTIPCGSSLALFPKFKWQLWLDRLMISRLENKAAYVEHLYNYTKNNYEETLYILLCRNFGFKINNDAFELLAKSLPFSLIKKYADDPLKMEALLYGTAGLLDEMFEDKYPSVLQNEFVHLKNKHQLQALKKESWKFSKTRPVNFPTIRLSQLVNLFSKNQSLYHLLETFPDLPTLKLFFNVTTNSYWNTHYKFDVLAEEKEKSIGDVSINSIIINTIVPFLFFKSHSLTDSKITEYALDLLSSLPPESNNKTNEFSKLGKNCENALESQAQIQLYDTLCSRKACLHCNVGEYLLKNSSI